MARSHTPLLRRSFFGVAGDLGQHSQQGQKPQQGQDRCSHSPSSQTHGAHATPASDKRDGVDGVPVHGSRSELTIDELEAVSDSVWRVLRGRYKTRTLGPLILASLVPFR